jgi:hypothetical protein
MWRVIPSIILPICEAFTTKLRFSEREGLSLNSKDSPTVVVKEDGTSPLHAEEEPSTTSLICHSNNGMFTTGTNKMNPRLARRKGMKLRSMMFE